MTKLFAQVHTTPAVSQRDGNRALCACLANDVFVEFGSDFPWGHY
jgi:hypothetical protein